MKRFVLGLLPLGLRATLRAKRYFNTGEPEVRWLARLIDPARASIDVGANNGVYSWWMSRLSVHCYAFEPNPVFQAEIKASGRNITPSSVALSNVRGVAQLFIPADRQTGNDLTGLATLRQGEDAAGRTFEVQLAPLDSFDMQPVGLIKIDVEGHEMEVLEGALTLISRDRPIVLIEAEERHRLNAVGSLVEWFARLDMTGFWLKDDIWHPVSQFRWQEHQNPASIDEATQRSRDPYFNNFIFVPVERLAAYPFLKMPDSRNWSAVGGSVDT